MSSPTPPSLTPNALSAQVAYKCSVAVAKALIELELPGSLARATAMLRAVAKEQAEEEAPLDGAGEEEDYMPFEASRSRATSAGGEESLDQSLRGSVVGDEYETYQPFAAAAADGASSGRLSPADSSASGTSPPLRSHSPTAAAAAAVASDIDWSFVNEEVHQSVLRVYDQILATAQWLEDAEGEGEGEGEGGGEFTELRDRRAAGASLDAITEEWDGSHPAAADDGHPRAMSSTAAAVTRSEKPPAMASTPDMLLRRVAARWAMENVAMVAFRARLHWAFQQWSHIAKALGPDPTFLSPGGQAALPAGALPPWDGRRKRASITKWRDVPAVPGLPSMERVWRSLFGGGGAVSKRRSDAAAPPNAAAPGKWSPTTETLEEPKPMGLGQPPELVDVDAIPAAGMDRFSSTRASLVTPTPATVAPLRKPTCRVHLLPGGWSGDCEDGFVACFITMDE